MQSSTWCPALRGARRNSVPTGASEGHYDTDLQGATDAVYEALARVPRVLEEPAPAVNLDGFGDSSLGFNVLYWHASDVPAELAARHDLVLTIHQAFAARAITIAFPQVVVWGGEPRPDRLYGGRVSEVRTPYPGLSERPDDRPSRATAWRLPGRQRSESD